MTCLAVQRIGRKHKCLPTSEVFIDSAEKIETLIPTSFYFACEAYFISIYPYHGRPGQDGLPRHQIIFFFPPFSERLQSLRSFSGKLLPSLRLHHGFQLF